MSCVDIDFIKKFDRKNGFECGIFVNKIKVIEWEIEEEKK